MSEADPDELLASLREGISQTAIPSIAAQFIELDAHLRGGGPLPSDWQRHPPVSTGALPVIEPCPHCSDGTDPTGYCNRPGCPECAEFQAQHEDSTCGVCCGMLSIQAAPQ